MKIPLKEFQEASVLNLYHEVQNARREVAGNGRPQAIVLSAPTGSGKTIVVTALLERILYGDDAGPGDPNACFLWVTDQPDLNEQSRRKILTASTAFGPGDLITIDAALDQQRFSPGKVYFLNTQKVGRDTFLVTHGDERQYTIWETVSATVAGRVGSFYVVLDEAHKGMQESTRDREQAASIVQKFIKGSPGEVPAVPLIIGISATPERFLTLLGQQRPQRRVVRSEDIEPADIRESGLLKDRVQLFHPDERGPTDWTLLIAATRKWQSYTHHWAVYSTDQDLPEIIRPILVVQVEDAANGAVSRTDIGQALRVIEETAGPLPDEAVAHAFQEGYAVVAGERTIRRVSPADINDDQNVRVVFFKLSLNTGWDCPRAEVMMSFRRAIDHTAIAQLVGRMVRTPLARRIDTNDFLNTVGLYLPHYDAENLDRVIGHLTQPDPGDQIGIEVEDGNSIVDLSRASGADALFAAADGLPSYEVSRVSRASDTRRLMRLAQALAYDGFREEAQEEAVALVMQALLKELERSSQTDDFNEAVARGERLRLREVTVQYGVEAPPVIGEETATLATANFEDQFEVCGRQLGEGLHLWYGRHRTEQLEATGLSESDALVAAKLELITLLGDRVTMEAVQKPCGAQVKAWLDRYQTEIQGLEGSRRDTYRRIRRSAATPEAGPLKLPPLAQYKRGAMSWPRHIFVDATSQFSCDLTSWEQMVLNAELAQPSFLGWLRNPERKPWSLVVPYRLHGEDHPFYPDFLIFRSAGSGVAVDIVEPHRSNRDDFWPKAVGLAEYAAKHGDQYGRVEIATVLQGNSLRRLNLNDEDVRRHVRAVTSNDELRRLFEQNGYV